MENLELAPALEVEAALQSEAALELKRCAVCLQRWIKVS